MALYEEKSKTPVEMKISRSEALEMQYKLIDEWKPKSDTWSLRFGGGILSAGSIVTSLYLMNHYRTKLKLFKYGRPLMFVPGVIVPALILPVIHQSVVSEPLIMQEAVCPVCIQLRAACLQASLSIAYPTIVHSLGAFSLANSFATYHLPAFTFSTLPQIFGVWKKISLPLQAVMPWHLAAQVALAFCITEWQAQSFFNIQEKILQKIKSSS